MSKDIASLSCERLLLFVQQLWLGGANLPPTNHPGTLSGHTCVIFFNISLSDLTCSFLTVLMHDLLLSWSQHTLLLQLDVLLSIIIIFSRAKSLTFQFDQLSKGLTREQLWIFYRSFSLLPSPLFIPDSLFMFLLFIVGSKSQS